MELYARQGDLVIDAKPIPDGVELRPEKDLILAGRDSAPHTVRGTVLAARQGAVTYLRVEQATRIDHAGRHRTVPLVVGDYEVRPLRERYGDANRAVVD